MSTTLVDSPEAVLVLEFENAVYGYDERIVAKPYRGDCADSDEEWIVEFQNRDEDDVEWRTVSTSFATEQPLVSKIHKYHSKVAETDEQSGGLLGGIFR